MILPTRDNLVIAGTVVFGIILLILVWHANRTTTQSNHGDEMTPKNITDTTRIEQYAESLAPGKIVTASEVVRALNRRSITEHMVGRAFATMSIMEHVKGGNGNRGKWRRI